MLLLEGKNLTKHFGGLSALVEVTFEINQGEIVGLIGPNGAGKTTLFNLISGALVPNSGSISFKGENLTGLKPYRICRKGVARTFQDVKIFPSMTILENVLSGALFGTSSRESRVRGMQDAMGTLDFVGLSVMVTIPARDLTLANQKRLEVARALITKPELLLLDELIAGLNPTEVAEAMELITRIRDMGVTIFVIEHVMKAIMGICDRILVLHHGMKIAEGTPLEIANNQTVIDIYLGE
jgi:branched-chain amino acid transport system ATP-binding protein